jgi:hypothetical protein
LPSPQPILAKYYVCDVARPPGRARVYSFEPQGFYRRLKARVKEQLRGQPRGPTSDLQAMASALLITYAALFGWACYSGSKRALVGEEAGGGSCVYCRPLTCTNRTYAKLVLIKD